MQWTLVYATIFCFYVFIMLHRACIQQISLISCKETNTHEAYLVMSFFDYAEASFCRTS